jgi:hypothetical protein
VKKFVKKSFGIFGSDVQCRKKSLKVCDDWRKSQNLKNNVGFFVKKGFVEEGLEGMGELAEDSGEGNCVCGSKGFVTIRTTPTMQTIQTEL